MPDLIKKHRSINAVNVLLIIRQSRTKSYKKLKNRTYDIYKNLILH